MDCDFSPVVICGDCVDELKNMPDNSVDAIVTDPPYGLSHVNPEKMAEVLVSWVSGDMTATPDVRGGFMHHDWDSFVPPPAVWSECLRVLKPGGHMAVFASTRTQDLMGLSLRLAGCEIRDCLSWLYATGMPKGVNVAKAVESQLLTGKSNPRSLKVTEHAGNGKSYTVRGRNNGILGATKVFQRKEFSPSCKQSKKFDGYSTALKPACEPIILARKPLGDTIANTALRYGTGGLNIGDNRTGDKKRYPTNVLIDSYVAEQLGEKSQFFPAFFTPKPPKSQRPEIVTESGERITHPTTKPVELLEWLVRLITPAGGSVLDPFAGSGTTLEAARNIGRTSIGIERNEDYVRLLNKRLSS